jgi:hypothetical protein
VTTNITVDVAGGPAGGAARFRAEFFRYLDCTGRKDVKVIGTERRLDVTWMMRRELAGPISARRVALNNVGFIAPGGERWTLLRNVLNFLTDKEMSDLEPSLAAAVSRRTAVVRMAARRSDVVVAPSTSMAERVVTVIPDLHNRIVIRPHPVSADSIPALKRDPAILCPVIFESYKPMANRLTELLDALERSNDSALRLRVTAERTEVPAHIANHPRLDFIGRLTYRDLCQVWGRSSAIYFPTGLESFGYPLAEARVSGHPVIGLDTAQNREIAGNALCGFATNNPDSMHSAVALALTKKIEPDPAPFDPSAYFDWMLGFHNGTQN